MKTLLLFLLFSFNLGAQCIPEKNYKDAIIGAGILCVTFITIEANGPKMTRNQIAFTAMSGIVISAGRTLYMTSDLRKRVQRRFKPRNNMLYVKHNK